LGALGSGMGIFKLNSSFSPAGDQVKAIEALSQARPGRSTLLGVTGSGKTYTLAQVIAKQSKPVLILAPNKTLAAQLYEEFSGFFPENKVCYFVSYYDYYQPESYMPAQDMYVPKEAKINAEIERLRIEATASLINRPDTIIIASVSSIYSLGDPTDYRTLAVPLSIGQEMSLDQLSRQLMTIQYHHNTYERGPGSVQVVDDKTIEISPPYMRERLRIIWNDGHVEKIQTIRKLDDSVSGEMDTTLIFPARHFVTTGEKRIRAMASIEQELEAWLPKLAEPHRERLKARVERDLDMLAKRGHCAGIENYSIHFDGRPVNQAPFCLFDFFKDFLLILDESHIMIPQLQGMYAGDRARKNNLVTYGFRLPSAYDNRPLRFEEIERYFRDVIFVSATPGSYELAMSDMVAEQVVRPTGLVDPPVDVRPRIGQLQDLVREIQETNEKGYRTLVTVLTKKLAEELALYLEGQKIRVCYLHSDLKTPQRTEILHKLRAGIFDCVVGVNLLREGLDLPEVARVIIMDADIEGFLRDKRSLIQTIGRAARNVDAKVVLYADKITQSMRDALDETERRRTMQMQHNEQQGITPRTVIRDVVKSISPIQALIARATEVKKPSPRALKNMTMEELTAKMVLLEQEMHAASSRHDYDTAIRIRDEWFMYQKRHAEVMREKSVAHKKGEYIPALPDDDKNTGPTP